MTGIVNINVGTVANDGTGESLRSAYQRSNTNDAYLDSKALFTVAELEALTADDGLLYVTIISTGNRYKYSATEPTTEYVISSDLKYWELLPSRDTEADSYGSLSAAAQTAINKQLTDENHALLPSETIVLSDSITIDTDAAIIRGFGAGYGTAGSVLSNAATGNDSIQIGAGVSRRFGIQLGDFRVGSVIGEDNAAYGLKFNNVAYGRTDNVISWFHHNAAAYTTANVGQTNIGANFSRSEKGVWFYNPSSLLGNTFWKDKAGKIDLVETVYHTDDNGSGTPARGIFGENQVYENFNKLLAQSSATSRTNLFDISNSWFEGFGAGAFTAPSTTGSGDGILYIEGANWPHIRRSNLVGLEGVDGSFHPVIDRCHITPVGSYAKAKFTNLDMSDVFTLRYTSNGFGELAVAGSQVQLPLIGTLQNPTECYGTPTVFDSAAVTNLSGVYLGASNGCENLLANAPGGAAWTTGINYGGTYALTTGQADPYGGTSAVRITEGYVQSLNIAALANGGEWVTVVAVVKAVTTGDALVMRLGSLNGGTGHQYNFEGDLPDTEWRLAYITQEIPANAGADYRLYIGSNGGAYDFARIALFNGSKIQPPIDYGENITEPFIFEHGKVLTRGKIRSATSSELTIASGAITATGNYHTVDTQSDAASDDLDTINGGEAGMRLVIQPENGARTVVAKNGTGNLSLIGDFSMDDAEDKLELIYDGSNWCEISRSSQRVTPTELTIASGAVTITGNRHSIDTESDAATDDLETINGGSLWQQITIHAEDSARTVVAKDGVGNLALAGDFSMDNTEDRLTLEWDGTNWCEISRSDNGA